MIASSLERIPLAVHLTLGVDHSAIMQVILAWVFLYQLSGYMENLPRIQQLANPPGITEIVASAIFGFARFCS